MKIIVFAGGVGTRLWPLSRKNSPKQFEKFIGNKSTLQQTVERLMPEFAPSDIYIATGKKYEEIVTTQLPSIPAENFIFEPAMRDVGPALGMVACILEKNFSNEPVAILWSDHLVKNESLFRSILRLSEKKINDHESEFIFITQKPRFANQNMGWIEVGEKLSEAVGARVYTFKRLIYRPKLEEAEEFFQSESFMWNLGYFVTTPRYLSSLFKQYAGGIYDQLCIIADAWGTERFEETLQSIYPKIEKTSFDDAVLVKVEPSQMQVVSADLGWSDIGAWESLKEALASHVDENVTKGDVLLNDSRDTLVFNYTDQLVVGIDLDEMLIISTEDVLLVCPKSAVPKIKKVVERLEGTKHERLT